jgi:hypothetical protein
MKKYVLSIPSAISDRIGKAHKQGKFSALLLSQFIQHLVTMGLDEYQAQCEAEQVKEGARLQAVGCEAMPEAIRRKETKVIQFPGVTAKHEVTYQNALDGYIRELGHIE